MIAILRFFDFIFQNIIETRILQFDLARLDKIGIKSVNL